MTYDQNLTINFQFNKNLHGKNISRAIKDFQRVTQIAQNHAFAWNCLVIGYSKTGQKEKMRIAKSKTKEIIENDDYWRSKFEQLDFPIASVNC